MGTQFWWFYDVIAAAIVLICIFISGKRGFMKAALTTTGFAISLALSMAISSGISESLYTNTLRSTNIKKINKVINSETFTSKYAAYLESLSYNIRPSTEKLNAIFDSDKDYDEALCKYINNVNGRRIGTDEEVLEIVHEGYAQAISGIVSQGMSKYAAGTAAEELRRDSNGMQELIPLLREREDSTPAAKYITDNYTAPAFVTIYKLAGFLILFVLLSLLIILVINSMTKSSEASGVGSHIAGGFVGLIKGGIITFAAAAAVRLWTVLGSNEMLFFNNDAIDKTYVFKYFSEFVSKL